MKKITDMKVIMKSLLNKRLRIIPSALALIVSLAWETAVVLGQTLPVVSSGTLLVHLEADAGVSTDVPGGTNITSWTDQSGNSFYFPADVSSTNRAYPTLTTNDLGIPLVHFAGTGLFGDSGSLSPSVELFPTSSSALTIFTVFRTAKSGSQEYLLDDAVNPISSAYDVTMELGVDAGARGTGNYGLHRGSGDATFTPNNTISNNVLYVMTTVIKPNGYPPDNVEIYKDGIAQSLGTAYGGGKPLYPGWLAGGQYAIGDQGLFIGGRVNALNSSVDANFSGDIGEILLYQGALSLHDRAAVEAYLASKYGVAVAPPPGLAITAQPQPLAVTNGESATFTVAADSANGDSIAYQWQKDGTNIDNATDASLTISSVSVTNVGAYQCVVSIPSTNVTSESVQLRLYTNTPLPAISSGTLLVHLEADAGVVTNGSDLTTWFDQSPNQFEFDVTTSPNLWLFAPTVTTGLTGNQVIHFGGAAQTESSVPIQLFTDTNSPLTVFAAFSVQDNSSQTYLFNSQFNPRVGRNFQELMVGVSAGNQNPPGSFGAHRAAGCATVTAPDVVSNNQFNIMSMVIKSNGVAPHNIEIYQNGNYLPVDGFNPNPASDLPPDQGWLGPGDYPTGAYPLFIGTAADSSVPPPNFSPVGPLAGDIAELIIYQGQLSPTDRGRIESYLGQKYGISVAPPPALIVTAEPQTVGITNGSGQSATFSVTATTGTGETNGLTYQWQKNGVDIARATNSSYSISSASLTDVGSYGCVVSFSGTSVTSDSAQLRLLPEDLTLPAVSTGDLLVHLEADAGVVTTDGTTLTNWFDQSPNHYEFDALNNPTNTPPIVTNGLTGNRVIHFNGLNNNVLCSLPFQLFAESNSSVTIFTAFSAQDNANQRYLVTLRVPRIGPAYFTNSPGWTPNLTAWFNEFSLGVDAGARGAGNYGVHRAAGDSTWAPNNTIHDNQFYTMCLVVKSTGDAPNNIAIYQDGVALPVTGYLEGNVNRGPRDDGWLSPGDYPTGSSNEGGNYELRIGATRDATLSTPPFKVGNCLLGDIGEVIIYTGELSDSDRTAVENYLEQKYGSGTPRLSVTASGSNVVISYPVAMGTTLAGTYMLESTASLSPPTTWTPVTPSPVVNGDQYMVTNQVSRERFYRLHLMQ